MALKIRSMKDFSAGLMFIALGAGFALGASQYPMGSAVRMGPAYFPYFLGWLTVLLGSVVLIGAFIVDAEKPSVVVWRPVILVIGSVVAFAALIDTGGLIAATITQIVLSALGYHDVKWKEIIISAVALSITVWLAFDVALGLPFKLFPWS